MYFVFAAALLHKVDIVMLSMHARTGSTVHATAQAVAVKPNTGDADHYRSGLVRSLDVRIGRPAVKLSVALATDQKS